MKRLILMGGRPWVTGDKGKSFTNALFRYFPNEVKLAFCMFAQPETEWEATEKWNKSMFDSFKGSRNLSFKTMTHETFEEFSRWADVIYIPGGDPFKLIEEVKKHNVEKLWDSKTVAGSSAGADLLCKGFPYLQEKRFGNGLSWLNLVMIPHWRDDFNDYTDSDWDWAEQEALKHYPNSPVICIPEGQFTEFTVL